MPSFEFLPTREPFLPVRPGVLLERLLGDPRLSHAERDLLRKFYEMAAARFHHEYHSKAERLKDLYAPFDPDSDTLPSSQLPPAERERRRGELDEAIRSLLVEGHYLELPRRTIVECVELQNFGGLKVEADLDDYTQLAIYYRGVQPRQRCFRPWRRLWRRHARSFTVFRRAALLVRTAQQADRIHLKLFKDIVAEDLEMILPHVRVRMRWIDGLKIGSGVAGSLATAAWKAFTAALLSPWLFLIVLGTFLTAVIRALLAYFGSKTRYMHALSANLYFQNIANNASALSYLVDSAEGEEIKEFLLAFTLLYLERDQDLTAEDLGVRIGRWLCNQFDMEIAFDARDAVRKLIDRGLAVARMQPAYQQPLDERAAEDAPLPPARAVIKVFDLRSALRRLDAAWDGFFGYNSGQPGRSDRLADAGAGAVPASRPGVQGPGPHADSLRRGTTAQSNPEDDPKCL